MDDEKCITTTRYLLRGSRYVEKLATVAPDAIPFAQQLWAHAGSPTSAYSTIFNEVLINYTFICIPRRRTPPSFSESSSSFLNSDPCRKDSDITSCDYSILLLCRKYLLSHAPMLYEGVNPRLLNNILRLSKSNVDQCVGLETLVLHIPKTVECAISLPKVEMPAMVWCPALYTVRSNFKKHLHPLFPMISLDLSISQNRTFPSRKRYQRLKMR